MVRAFYHLSQVMLGLPLGPAVDTWACATVAFELLGKGKLFDSGSQVPPRAPARLRTQVRAASTVFEGVFKI